MYGVLDLQDNMTPGLKKAERGLSSFGRRTQAAGRDIMVSGAKITALTAPLTLMGGVAAKSAIEWEDAFAGVRKTVDGTEDELAALEAGLRELATSADHPVSSMENAHVELAAIAEAAGQLGVRTEDILKFTETMGMLAMSTNLGAEEAAVLAAQFQNVTGMNPDDIDNFGATIVALGNNSATTEKDIMNMAQRVAAAGSMSGMTEAQILALSAAMASVGIRAEAGGTAMSKTIKTMTVAVFEGEEALEGFATVSGMTADEFAKAWRTDPAQALDAFLIGLGQLEDWQQLAFLEGLGLDEARVSDTLLRLASSASVADSKFADVNNTLARTALNIMDMAHIADPASARVSNAFSTMTLNMVDALDFAKKIDRLPLAFANDLENRVNAITAKLERVPLIQARMQLFPRKDVSFTRGALLDIADGISEVAAEASSARFSRAMEKMRWMMNTNRLEKTFWSMRGKAGLLQFMLGPPSAIDQMREAQTLYEKLSSNISGTSKNTGLLTGALELANRAWSENTALVSEAEKRAETTKSGINRLKNNLRDLGITVGSVILPPLNDFLNFLTPLINRLSDANPEIIQVGVALAAAAVAAGPLITIIGGIVTAVGFLLTPLGLAAAGIAALVAALATDFGGLRSAITDNIDMGMLKRAGESLLGFGHSVYEAFEPLVGGFVQGVTAALEPFGRALGDLVNAASAVVDGDWNTAKDHLSNFFVNVGDAIEGFASPAIKGGLETFERLTGIDIDMEKLKQFGAELVAPIADGLRDLGSGISDFFDELEGTETENIEELLQALAKFQVIWTRFALLGASEAIGGALTAISEALGPLGSAVSDFISAIDRLLAGDFGGALEKLGAGILNLSDATTSANLSSMQEVLGWIEDITGQDFDALDEFFQKMKEMNFEDEMEIFDASKFKAAWSEYKNQMGNIVDDFGAFFDDLKIAWSEYRDQMGQIIDETVPKLTEFDNILGDITGTLTGLFSNVSLDDLRSFISDLEVPDDWSALNETLAGIQSALTGIALLIGGVIDKFEGITFNDVWATLADKATIISDAIASIAGNIGSVIDSILGFDGVTDAWREFSNTVSKIASAITTISNFDISPNVPGGDGGGGGWWQAGTGALGALWGDNKNAAGGSVRGGVPTVVGERGRELFVPATDGQIVPNHKIGRGAVVYANIEISGQTDPVRAADQFIREMQRRGVRIGTT